jgi:hypothetical protein
MRRVAALFLAVLSMSAPAWAQAPASAGTAGGVLATSQTWDDEGSIGTGVGGGGRVGWRLFGTTSIEGSLDILRHDRSGGAFESQGTSTIGGVSLVHRFGRRVVQPYLLGGLDLVRHSGETTFDARRTPHHSSDGAYHFGFGAAARVRRLELGPEARFYVIRVSNDSDPAWASFVGVRVALVY